MEVTALCSTLMVHVWMLAAHVPHVDADQKHGAMFPRVVPNRLQFFEYESISFSCKAGWRVMRGTNASQWAPSAVFGTIEPAFCSDSGAYWCEDGGGLRGSAVNVCVTAAHVILESPAVPVKDGDHVTLDCKKKRAADFIAEFYKDGVHIGTGYHGKMTIRNASTWDEGLYKCHVEDEYSAESLLAVRGAQEEDTPPHRSEPPAFHTLLWIGGTVLLAALLLVVFVRGVLRCNKPRGGGSTTKVSGDDGDVDVVDSTQAVYSLIQKPRKDTEPRASSKPRLPEESAIYSLIA